MIFYRGESHTLLDRRRSFHQRAPQASLVVSQYRMLFPLDCVPFKHLRSITDKLSQTCSARLLSTLPSNKLLSSYNGYCKKSHERH